MTAPWDRMTMRAAFDAICDCGGRQSGTDSEAKAVALLRRLGREATGVEARAEPVAYEGWRAVSATLRDGAGQTHPVNPLVRSAPTAPGGVEAEVLDLGRGTPEAFAAHRDEIGGRIVLVRHELMFSAGTIHRRLKYGLAAEAGAAGFLIAGPEEGALVAGSSGRSAEPGPPAAGVTPQTARALARSAAGHARVHLEIVTEEGPASADNLFFDLRGETDEWVVLSAHIDGHALGESAIDNASGLAVALAAASAVASGPPRRRGLRLALFNVEEWALTGSRKHVEAITQAERDAIALNVNLDSVGGGDRLTALTSGFAGIEPMLLEAAEQAGAPLGLYRPLQTNSDHANFATAGIPAFRLVAGFDDPSAGVRLVLTPLDRRGMVSDAELDRALAVTLRILDHSLDAKALEAARWRM